MRKHACYLYRCGCEYVFVLFVKTRNATCPFCLGLKGENKIVSPGIFVDGWQDDEGIIRELPGHSKGLSDDVLREYIYRRDNLTCQTCGTTCSRGGIWENGEHLVIDHILSVNNGGDNHPGNLQVLCHRCNSRKAGLVDAKHKDKR